MFPIKKLKILLKQGRDLVCFTKKNIRKCYNNNWKDDQMRQCQYFYLTDDNKNKTI